ncbi:hypothetical protein niasHT_003297 [Heterodera trifolii]|uniref:BTB domain-containing protein n=1 Tax=Heterodera trifolii TaxID=157864 RepID=A0ABD2LXR9_9BILA
MPSSMDRMKHLLSTGEHSDVHFLVGDGDEKEVLPAHQFILKIASDVFEAMFRFDAKKERPENDPANCLAEVEIPDIEPSAFKVMLSFIYTDDLSALNGDNAMAVLYAANKYNIPDLVLPSLQIPISELRNVFLAYAQALLFELEALRWADEKCRQNGIECSSENRRSVLGPALFKIRFPNIHEEIFAKCVVPSSVLTEKELLGIYQFNSHPNIYLRGIPGLYSLKFPSHGQIFNWNKAQGNKKCTIALEIEKVDTLYINWLPWKIGAEIRKKTEGTDEKKFLGFYLWCDAKEGPSNCVFSATYRIVSEKSDAENSIGTRCDCIINKSQIGQGFGNFISFTEFMDPAKGFYDKNEDKVTLTIDVTVKEEKMEKFIFDQSKSNGKISMEIEKVSEFAREIKGSERTSESVHIGGFPWKISAEINPKKGSTDNEEKWLGIYLLCDAPKEDKTWECKCLATLRIVSQKSNTGDYCRKFSEERTFNSKSNSTWGYDNFISFAELMDPAKGFYDKSEDKVTLAIDVNVKEAKTEDNS